MHDVAIGSSFRKGRNEEGAAYAQPRASERLRSCLQHRGARFSYCTTSYVTSACRGIFLLLLPVASFVWESPEDDEGQAKIEAQKRAAEKNEKPKGSQIEARNAGLKTVCSVCKAPLANYKQLVDHFASKHPKEAVPPAPSS